MTTEQILAALDVIRAQLRDIGEQIERIGESLSEPVRLYFEGEDVIEVHIATGVGYYHLPDMTPIDSDDHTGIHLLHGSYDPKAKDGE